MRRTPIAVGLAVLVFLAAAAIGAVYVSPLVGIGVAYKAKMLCSGVYVARGDPGSIVSDLEIDDLKVLRHVRTSVDSVTSTVTATALGVERRAVHRPGEGCALVNGPEPPSGALLQRTAATVSIDSRRSSELPTGPTPPRLATVLEQAFQESTADRPRRTRAVLVIHRGVIIGERYSAGVGPGTPLPGWSMTKSVMNALVGILVNNGRLELDRTAPVPEWQGPGDRRGGITLDHLLRMSSGLQFDEDMTSPSADIMLMLFSAGDMAAFATAKELEATPGSRWQYSSGTSNIIARTIRTVLQDDTEYVAFPRRALFDPLGMKSATIETDAAGTFVGSSYMYATARDWARFGMLYLQDGVREGNRILPEGWVSYSVTPAPADPAGQYGAHFWLDVPAEYRAADDGLPPDAFHAAGHEGQFITIVPSQDVVIVRLGRTRYPEAWDHDRFVRDVLAALD